MIMDKDERATTFLTSLFCKFSVTDKDTRKCITNLYSDIISSIFNNTPEKQRVVICTSLINVIRQTIVYITYTKQQKITRNDEELKVIKQLILYSKELISYIPKKSNKVFDEIMKQVNIDEIACDMGECSVEYKKAKNHEEKINALCRLKVLLDDYNIIMKTTLTVRDILRGRVLNKNRFQGEL